MLQRLDDAQPWRFIVVSAHLVTPLRVDGVTSEVSIVSATLSFSAASRNFSW
jgi:hypothetical protein